MARKRNNGLLPEQQEEAHQAAQALFDIPTLAILPHLEAMIKDPPIVETQHKITDSIMRVQQLVTSSPGFTADLAIKPQSMRGGFTPAEDRYAILTYDFDSVVGLTCCEDCLLLE